MWLGHGTTKSNHGAGKAVHRSQQSPDHPQPDYADWMLKAVSCRFSPLSQRHGWGDLIYKKNGQRPTAPKSRSYQQRNSAIFLGPKSQELDLETFPECIDVADQLITLDGRGNANLDVSEHDKEVRMEMIRSLNSGHETVTEEGEAQEQARIRSSLEQETRATSRDQEPKTNVRRDGDVSLYWLFIDPMGRAKVLLWTFVMFLASVGEMAPDVYMRLWIERDAGNNLYFIGYASIAVVACLLFVAAIAVLMVNLMPRASLNLHQQLVDTVLRATIGFLGTTDNGVMINRFSQDMTLMARTLVIDFIRTISVFFTATLQAGIIASAASYLALILPLIGLGVYFIQCFYLRTSRQIRILDLEKKSPLYTHFQETTEGLTHIRAFGWQEENMREAFKLLDDSQKGFYYMYCIQQWLGLVLEYFATAIGLSFLNLILFAKTLEQLIGAWTDLETSVGALDRLREFMTTTPQEPDTRGGDLPEHWPSAGKIELVGVNARYSAMAEEPAILKNVSFSVEAGQKVGVIGRTGSGKSSLFLALLGFLHYDGTMKIDGVDVSSVPVDELRSRIWSALEDDDKAGLDTLLDDAGYSHGQMQVFCLARGILRAQDTGSKVVLIDEATSSVEEELERTAQEAMKEWFADCTVLVIGHRESSIRNLNVTVELSNGEVVDSSQPALDGGDVTVA
ncbi:hypothetical protein NLG97_g8769 [Lecanicillium saksenae]|uniref:Uncharacterized protein n=1 Tax=Lecanicillium saksenae TaxID=468837 RepID=A0ACC1QJ68_9HYPO|nr:hypothetical protein NLG97_g8769 [Lecanicillium saksenae]